MGNFILNMDHDKNLGLDSQYDYVRIPFIGVIIMCIWLWSESYLSTLWLFVPCFIKHVLMITEYAVMN